MFLLHGWIGAKPGNRDELLAILAEGELAEPMPIIDTEGFKRQQLDARAGIPD